MEQNKIRTYALYALGEILLVVIGILIALQVNNWNEERIKQQQINSYLEQIQEEILIDLNRSNIVARFLERKDELIHGFLTNQFDESDFRTNPELINLITNSITFSVNKNGFENLISIVDEASFPNKELLRELKRTYVNKLEVLETHEENFGELTYNYNTYLSENFDWASQLNPYETDFPRERIEYQMNDPIYRNRVNRYRQIANSNFQVWVYQFQRDFASFYKDIAALLNQETLPLAVSQYFESPPDSIASKIKGTYLEKHQGLILTDPELKTYIYSRSDSLFFRTPLIPEHQIVKGYDNRFLIRGVNINFMIEDGSILRNLQDRSISATRIEEE